MLAVFLSLGNGGMDRRMEIRVCSVRSRERDEGMERSGKLSHDWGWLRGCYTGSVLGSRM